MTRRIAVIGMTGDMKYASLLRALIRVGLLDMDLQDPALSTMSESEAQELIDKSLSDLPKNERMEAMYKEFRSQ